MASVVITDLQLANAALSLDQDILENTLLLQKEGGHQASLLLPLWEIFLC